MHRTVRDPRALGLALLLLAVGTITPVAAQSHRGAITFTGGGSVHGDLSPGMSSATTFESGWITGGQLEGWLGSGRVGLRLNGLYTRRVLEDSPDSYTVMSGDLDVLVRLLAPRADRGLTPYVGVGAGATRYAATDTADPIAGGAYGEDPVRIHGMVGLGTDVALGPRTGLRLEVADQLVLPSIGESPPSSGLPITHNVIVTAGLQLRMGAIWGQPARRRSRPQPEPVAAPRAEETRGARPGDGADAAVPRFTIQLGTFMDGHTADWWLVQLGERGLPAWAVNLEAGGQRLSRLRVGAFATETEARAVLDALRQDYDEGMRVDEIDARDAPPANALRETREFMAAQ